MNCQSDIPLTPEGRPLLRIFFIPLLSRRKRDSFQGNLKSPGILVDKDKRPGKWYKFNFLLKG